MNSLNQKVLIGLGSAAIGYFIAKVHLERVYEDIAAEQIAEAKHFYDQLYREKAGEEALPAKTVEVVERVTSFAASDAAKAVVDYQSFYDNKPKPSEPITPEPLVEAVEEGNMNGMIHVIDYDQYTNDDSGYEKNYVHFWAGDNVVTGIDKIPMSDEYVAKFMGDETLEPFMEDPYDGEDTIYVRNTAYGQDFEIHYQVEALSQVQADG